MSKNNECVKVIQGVEVVIVDPETSSTDTAGRHERGSVPWWSYIWVASLIII